MSTASLSFGLSAAPPAGVEGAAATAYAHLSGSGYRP